MKRGWTAALALFTFSSWAANGPSVEFETTLGNFTVELNQEKAPVSADNFVRYVQDGSYVGSIFHRIIPGFMVQGGGYNQQMQRLDTYNPIPNEAANGLENNAATIAMARTQDPDSATRQFFINLVDNDFLNYGERPPGYAVFGVVTQGFETIELMAQQKTEQRGYMKDVPAQPIVITKATYIPAPVEEVQVLAEPTQAVDTAESEQTEATEQALLGVAALLAEENISSEPGTEIVAETETDALETMNTGEAREEDALTSTTGDLAEKNSDDLSALSEEELALRTAIQETLEQNSQVLKSMAETQNESSAVAQ